MDNKSCEDKENIGRVSPDAQLDALRDFSKQIRNRMIFFILFNIYALLNVLSTTDKDIFLLNPIKMPLLNIQLPLVAFYVLIPLFIVALHFNLLYKLSIYKDYLLSALSKNEEVIKTLPFGIYEEIILGQNPFFKILMIVFFISSIYILPIVVLFSFYFKFDDYHSFIISSWHLILIAFSFALIIRIFRFKKIFDKNIDYLLSRFITINETNNKINIILLILIIGIFTLYHIELFIVSFLPQKLPKFFLNLNLVPYLDVRGEILVKNIDKETLEILREFKNEKKKKPLLNYVLETDYSNRNFAFAKLNGSILINTNFYNVNLVRADLEKANLYKSRLVNANLFEANLKYTELKKTNFYQTNLAYADLSGVNLKNVNIKVAKSLVGIKIINTNLSNLDFSNLNLEKASLYKSKLLNVKLKSTILSNADLSEANLSDASLSGADLSEANLSDANLSDASLYKANLSDANLSDASLSGADLSEANLSDANLSDANLSGADLSGTKLFNAFLYNVNLSGAYLSTINLFSAELSNVKLKGVCSSYFKCNNPLILRVGKKADLSKIKNEILTEEKIKEILRRIKEKVDKEDYKKLKNLLYKFKGKTALDWIKAQDVNLGIFTEKDYKEHIEGRALEKKFKRIDNYTIKISVNLIKENLKKFIEKERKELKEKRKENYISQQEYEKYLKLLKKIEKEIIEEYREEKEVYIAFPIH